MDCFTKLEAATHHARAAVSAWDADYLVIVRISGDLRGTYGVIRVGDWVAWHPGYRSLYTIVDHVGPEDLEGDQS